jgi:hypothetical protein
MRAGDDVDRAAMTAVAAARSAARSELLAAECETAASAVARFDVNVDFVGKHLFTVFFQDPSRRFNLAGC